MNLNHHNFVMVTVFVAIHSIALGQEGTSLALRKLPIGDGVALHYVELGKGDPIIFVHGTTGDYSVWMEQLEAFAEKGYRAITYSRRYNYPNKNRLRPNHSASVEADDLAAFIRELKLPNAHIVGHSYGGYTALILSLKNPDLVRTLTLAEPPIASWLADLPGDTSEDGKALLTKLMSQFIEPVKLAFESDDEEMALRKFLDFVGGKGTLDRLPKSVEEMCRRNIKELKALMISEDRYPYIDREQVRRLNLPTLILSGGMSQDVAKLTDSELERLIPERLQKRVVLNGATHLMWTEQPEQSRMSVLEFIHGK